MHLSAEASLVVRPPFNLLCWRLLAALCLCGMVMGLTPLARSAPLVEVDDRLEVNWSMLRVRFFGEALVGSGEDGFKVGEKQAWREGAAFATEAVRSLNMTLHEISSRNSPEALEDAAKASKQVASSLRSYNTTYFADGTVRVHLESSLAKALTTSGFHFRQREAAQSVPAEYTGIVLRSAASTKPGAVYSIVDEHGDLLFDVHAMAQESYKKNLMGRWFRHPTKEELAAAVGASPLSIGVVPKDGRFVAKRQEWDEALLGHKSLLINGTIAIALP